MKKLGQGADLDWDASSFCSVAGITLDRSAPAKEFCIGDAAAMIPPLTGNGMSMAFESAEVAARHLIRYSAGQLDWGECVRAHIDSWRNAFGARLRWAGVVQNLVFRSAGQGLLYRLVRIFPPALNLFFARTR